MRKFIIAGNWKMNNSFYEALNLSESIVKGITGLNLENVKIIVCPPALNIIPVAGIVRKDSPVMVGAQNCHFEKSGAYTGEISAKMFKDVLVEYIIIGHSERRQYFYEDGKLINKKLKAILEEDITPILCIGESLEQRNSHSTLDVLFHQLDEALEGISNDSASKIIIAYEPIWAIGTGVVASPQQAAEAHDSIRNYLIEKFGIQTANLIPLLYGGSMKPDNIEDLLLQTNIDGGLIGGASLQATDFIKMIQSASKLSFKND